MTHFQKPQQGTMETNEVTLAKDESKESKDTADALEVPDGGYGWVVVAGCVCLNTTAAGTAAYSIYLAHYLEYSIFPGADKLDFAAIGGVQLGAGFALAPFIGIVNQILGVKLTIVIGATLTFLGYFLSGFVKQLWQLALTQGLLVGLGYGFIFVSAYTLVPQWFRKKRSWAVSITTAAAGLSGIMFNLSIQALIKNKSLRWAYIVQSIICAFLCAIGVLLVKTRDAHIRPVPAKVFDMTIARHPIFALMTFNVFMILQAYSVLLLSIADFTKTLGFTSTQGSVASCMIGIGFLFGRPTVGKIADHCGIITTSLFVYTFVAILCLGMWIPIRNYASVLAFALLQGLFSGSIWVGLSPMTSRLFGLRKLKNVLNMLWFTVGVSSIIAPIIGLKLRGSPANGAVYSATQYVHTAIYCGVCYFCAVVSLWIIRAYLIARDEVLFAIDDATKDTGHADGDELHTQVTIPQVCASLFRISKRRLV